MTKEAKDVISSAVNTITGKTKTVTVTLKPETPFQALLMKVGLKKKTAEFIIRPLVVGNRKRISAKALVIPDDFLKDGLVKALLNPEFIDVCIYAVAVGIQNNKHEPDQKLIDFIAFQFDDEDIDLMLNTIFSGINLKSFTNSIILIKGSNVLTVPEKDAESANKPD
jgi:hypothetical protein